MTPGAERLRGEEVARLADSLCSTRTMHPYQRHLRAVYGPCDACRDEAERRVPAPDENCASMTSVRESEEGETK